MGVDHGNHRFAFITNIRSTRPGFFLRIRPVRSFPGYGEICASLLYHHSIAKHFYLNTLFPAGQTVETVVMGCRNEN
jgi:hypothetical protein